MLVRFFTLILLCLAATTTQADDQLLQKQQDRIQTIKKIAPSVVCVMPAAGQGGGSGVLISSDGFAISNFHVTSGSGNFMKCGLNDGKLYDAVIVGIDPTGDVALIKLLGRNDFPFCTPGNSDDVKIGDEVLALGNPFLLAEDFSPTITYGIASGIHRYQYPADTFLEYTDCIQIDASINPGNSGGPLFDIQGRWIGINGRASFEKRGRINSGAAYAISVNQVLLFVDHLKSGRIIDHGRTEFTVGTTDEKVEIQQVSELSDVWRRGMRSGDELISFAGRAITSANDFKNIMGIFPDATRVPVTFRNDEGVHTVTTRLSPLHRLKTAPQMPGGPQPPEGPHDEEDKNPDLLDTKPQPPKQYEHLFVEKDGFTNFYFNEQATKQYWQAGLKAVHASASSASRSWKLNINASIKGIDYPGLMTVKDSAAGIDVKGLPPAIQNTDRLSSDSELPQLYGLLTGLVQWHQLAEQGQNSFSETVYIGSEKLLPSERIVHIIQTRSAETTSRWGFTDESPFPVSVDIQFSSGADEARIRFDEWHTDLAIPAPKRIGIIDHDREVPVWITIESIELGPPGSQKNGASE